MNNLLLSGGREGGAVTSLVFQGAELLVKDKRIIEGCVILPAGWRAWALGAEKSEYESECGHTSLGTSSLIY